jgi:hypothetical protein
MVLFIFGLWDYINSEKKGFQLSHSFAFVSLIFVVTLFADTFLWQIGSPATDMPAAALTFQSCLLFLRVIESNSEKQKKLLT